MTTLSDPALRLAGKPLASHLLAQVTNAAATLPQPPVLKIVRVGENPASKIYVARKLEACAGAGIAGEELHLEETAGEAALHALLTRLADDTAVNAIIVQLPLPAAWDVQAALDMVPLLKDCDGLSTANIQQRRHGDGTAILPATPLGILRLLASHNVEVAGRTVVVIGRGRVVGHPLREMLEQAGATVVPIDRDTPNPAAMACTADILISAAGSPGLVTAAWVKPGAVVVDVGLSRMEEAGKTALKGDVDAASVAPVAAALTPVPGGVGPLTVASLLTNIIDCTRLQAGLGKAAWTVTL